MRRFRRLHSMQPPVILALLLVTISIASAAGTGSDATAGGNEIFGPQTFTRQAGPPNVFTASFDHCGEAPAQIIVFNGNADGTNRASSASIELNGVQVIGPNEFNPHVERIEKDVILQEENEIVVRITGRPGSFITVSVVPGPVQASIVARFPGVDVPNPNTLVTAIAIGNLGTADATNVQITSLTLASGTLVTPLPINLGTIPVGGGAILHATFSGGPFLPGQTYRLDASGTFQVGAATVCFGFSIDLRVPPAADGSAILGTATIPPLTITGAPFPARPPNFPERGSNPPGWTVPDGAFVPDFSPPGSTGAQPPPGKAGIRGGPQVVFTTNRAVGITDESTTAEPSGHTSPNGVVFVTANWLAAYSTNDGVSFTELEPTTVFPNDAVGFCCDQIVQYAPSIDRFIWLLQGNGYRLAVASPAAIASSGGTAWTYWNLTPNVFGSCSGFDYPQMSLGNGHLYMSWDAGFGGCSPDGFQVVRTSLAGLQAGGTITVEFTDPANGQQCWGSGLSQDTGNEIFWAGHNSNSQLRIFSLADNSNTYFWRSRNISSWPNNAPTSIVPDGNDWLAKNFNGPGGNSFPRNGIIGSTRQFNNVWFAWTAGTNSNYQQAHVRMVAVDRGNNFSIAQQVSIWNNSYAFAYPALSTNFCSGDVGLSLEYGGGGNYQNHVVGFWGDFIVYTTTNSNVGTARFGDYVTLRRKPTSQTHGGNLFDAFGYGLRSSATGTQVDIRYVSFGRPPSVCTIPFEPPVAPPPVTIAEGSATLERGIRLSRDAASGHLQIAYAPESEGPVQVDIFDIRGRLVRTVVVPQQVPARTIDWDGSDAAGKTVASGIYLFRVHIGASSYSAKGVWAR